MEIIINIPEEIYKASQIIDVTYDDVIQIPLECISKGTPLPDPHGRIIDESQISSCEWCDEYMMTNAKTIIPKSRKIFLVSRVGKEDKNG